MLLANSTMNGVTVDIQIIDTTMTAIIDTIGIEVINDTIGLMSSTDATTDMGIATKSTMVTVINIDATVPGTKSVRIGSYFGSAKDLSQEFGGTFCRISANGLFLFCDL